jgi:hypothetical protein
MTGKGHILMIGTIALLAGTAAMAAPGDMNVTTFLAKADALKAKGIMALASSDVALLQAEGKAGGVAYRQRLKADAAAKRPPHSCPPAKAAVNSDEFLKHLRSYPEPMRANTSIKTATADLMKKRYPCK